MYWFGYSFILAVGLVIFGSGLVYLVQKRHHQTVWMNILLMSTSLFIALMFIELGFKLFFVQSDGFSYTLASQSWYATYWQTNSLGYRDHELTGDMLAGKTKVMVVGDSFVAGSGIANPANRFADQLGGLLGNDYVILNVASPGWDTLDQMQAITEYPYTPDILILSYYINDIEGTAYEVGYQRPQIRYDPPELLSPLVKNSYVINFLYWRVVRFGPQSWADVYWNDWMKILSDDPDLRWRHHQELLTIAKGAASEQIPFYVVVFPNLTAVEQSRFLTQPVLDLFRAQDVPTLDVSEILAGRDPRTTTVNAVDSHPNSGINQEVAQRLYEMINP